MNPSVSYVSPWEGLDIWWTFTNCNLVGPHNASESDNECQQGKNSSFECHIGPFFDFRHLIMIGYLPWEIHDQLSLHITILILMGQDQSNINALLETIAKRGLVNHESSMKLEHTMKRKQQKKLTNHEVQLGIDDGDEAGLLLKFIGKEKVDNFEEYSGFGEIVDEEGVKVFQGYFQEGKRNGFGIEYNEDMQIIYRGYFKDNSHHGWGVTPEYEGEFQKGKKCGWGKYYSLEKNIDEESVIFYEGFWENNQCCGFGALNVLEAEIESFLDLNSKADQGNHDYKYVGQWRNGKFSGIGKLVKKDEIYSGQFRNGLPDGIGTRIRRNHN